MSDIIKATAKFQEAEEPLKQRPIIHIERPLPNTIRASVDSGRDNPFRPDGKIYKSADPIVDYYKIGSNQSRPQSPTESELLLASANLDEKERKKLRKRLKEKEKERQKREKEMLKKATKGEKSEKPCWRRWFCCCCCCGRHKDNKQVAADQQEPYNSYSQSQESKTKDFKQTKIVVLRETTPANDAPDNNVTSAKDQAHQRPAEPSPGAEASRPVSAEQATSSTQVSNQQAKSSKRCVIS